MDRQCEAVSVSMSLLGLGWAACITGGTEQCRIRPTQIQRKEFLAFARVSQTPSRDLGFSLSERTMSSQLQWVSGAVLNFGELVAAFFAPCLYAQNFARTKSFTVRS